jgi:hypothetical protein
MVNSPQEVRTTSSRVTIARVVAFGLLVVVLAIVTMSVQETEAGCEKDFIE